MSGRDPLVKPEELIRRVYAYVAYRLGDGPDAEDVTSDVFERAVRYRASYDVRKGEPIAWLLGIARRLIAEWAAARPPIPVPLPDLVSDESLEESVIHGATLARAVAALEDRDRELIALRYGSDLTARQIGDLLGLRTNTVEVALHRAIERLRAALATETVERPRNVRVLTRAQVVGEEQSVAPSARRTP